MLKPQLFLHAGFHKTGTSAIQHFSAAHRRVLAGQGIIYPRLWPASFRPVAAHHFLAHAVAGNERFLTHSQAVGLVKRWRRSAVRCGKSVLLSSEAICRLSAPGKGENLERQQRFLRRLYDLLKEFEVTPVLVLRRQDDFVRSLYQEHVLEGLSPSASLSFEDFLQSRAADKPQFLARLRLFKSVFGTTRVLVYDNFQAQGLISEFFKVCGVALPARPRAERVVRSSLSPAQTLIKQRLNPFIRNRWQNRLLLRWLNSDRVVSLTSGFLAESGSLWPSVELRQQFLAQFDDENAQIGALFLDGRTQPFPALPNFGSQSPAPSASRVDSALAELIRVHRRRLTLILGRTAVARLLDRE